MSLFLTKQQQSARAQIVVNALEARYPHEHVTDIDRMAVNSLNKRRPTYPWEYPWAEVVRWCRDRRRS